MTAAPKRSVVPFGLASAILCALAIGGALLLPDATRSAGIFGAVAGSAGAVCALGSLAAFAGQGVQGVLLGFTVGFLCRVALVGIGLVASGARGDAALVYAGSFFALYLATQIVEVLFVAKSARSAEKGVIG